MKQQNQHLKSTSLSLFTIDSDILQSGRTTKQFRFTKLQSQCESQTKLQHYSTLQISSPIPIQKQRDISVSKITPIKHHLSQKSLTSQFNGTSINFNSIEPINQIDTSRIFQLYQESQRDCNLNATENNWLIFLERFTRNTQDGRFSLTNMGFLVNSITLVVQMLLSAPNFFMLNLSQNQFGDEAALIIVELINRSRSLVSITLQNNCLSNRGTAILIEAIVDHNSIVHFDLGSPNALHRNRIGADGSNALKRLLTTNKQITVLGLQSCSLEPNDILMLSNGLDQNTELISLDISCNSMTQLCTETLFDSMRFPSKLQFLDISDNRIGNLSMRCLGELLQGKSSIQKLNISNIGITGKGFCYVAMSLITNRCLQVLLVNKNSFHQQEMSVMQNMLENSHNLQILEMKSCNLQPQIGEFIGSGLGRNRRLQELHLGNNGLCDIGTTSLTLHMKNNKCLRLLSLRGNRINQEGGVAILTNLMKNSSLIHLDLTQNMMDDQCGLIALTYLHSHPQILQFKIEKNLIKYELTLEIMALVKLNQSKIEEMKLPALQNQLTNLKSSSITQAEEVQSKLDQSEVDRKKASASLIQYQDKKVKLVANENQKGLEVYDVLAHYIENMKVIDAQLFDIEKCKRQHQIDHDRLVDQWADQRVLMKQQIGDLELKINKCGYNKQKSIKQYQLQIVNLNHDLAQRKAQYKSAIKNKEQIERYNS